jgi:diamine N-acetyltransferase
MTLRLHRASKSELQSIRRMAERIWLAHYPEIIGMEQTQYMLEQMYSIEKLGEQQAAGQVFYLVRENETEVGFIGIRPLAGADEVYFIDKFYLEQTKQGAGLGSEAFRLLLAAYPEVKELRLQVNRQNYKSINFYFKNGFTIAQCLDVSIGDGYEMNDFLMTKRIS